MKNRLITTGRSGLYYKMCGESRIEWGHVQKLGRE